MPDSVIWVVEDDNVVAQLIHDLLVAEKYTVTHFSNGRVPIDHLRTGYCPSVMVLDLRMPPPDGNDVMRAVKALGRPPVILVTGFAGDIAPDLLTVPIKILDKPFTRHELLDTVEQALRSR